MRVAAGTAPSYRPKSVVLQRHRVRGDVHLRHVRRPFDDARLTSEFVAELLRARGTRTGEAQLGHGAATEAWHRLGWKGCRIEVHESQSHLGILARPRSSPGDQPPARSGSGDMNAIGTVRPYASCRSVAIRRPGWTAS